jgi:hypothetical protein
LEVLAGEALIDEEGTERSPSGIVSGHHYLPVNDGGTYSVADCLAVGIIGVQEVDQLKVEFMHPEIRDASIREIALAKALHCCLEHRIGAQ